MEGIIIQAMNTVITNTVANHGLVSPLNGVAALTHLGVIRVAGEDAAKFIHGQLTQDFSLLGLDEARLAAYCSAKGRIQASFIGFKRNADEILLVCSRDILAPTLKRLSMFVMRAKAKLSDVSDSYLVYGLAGSAIQTIAAHAHSTWAKVDLDTASLVNLYPADGIPRQLWVAPKESPPPPGQSLALETWLWGEVRSAVATITAPVVEAFVPQMINYESIGGVNFKKGCYPGQEVVARSQFRGTLKRRAFVVHADTPMAAGDELFVSDEQPVGTVVQAAAAPLGGFDAIVSAQLNAIGSEPMRLSHTSGPALTLLPLPYALLEDV